MATGSGKTITALAIAAELYKKCAIQNKALQALLIVCPYRHLVTQWAASTGQNQILSLAFIGSVIDRVRDWSRKHSVIGLDGGGFPIVMDSPSGSLDSLNRSNIADAITRLADQLVVLVSKTQWLNEVESEMEPLVRAEYVLVCYTAKADAQPEEMERYGRTDP